MNEQPHTQPQKRRGKNDFPQKMKIELENWRTMLAQLENEVEKLKTEARADYRQQLTTLRSRWQQLHDKCYAWEADEQRGQQAEHTLPQEMDEWRKTFMTTAERLHREQKVPLGWLQGYSEQRPASSEGWMEGYGQRPQGSEGWMEGYGQRPEGSKGWREGYDRTS